MSIFAKFFLTTIPAGISILFLLINKTELDDIFLKYDSTYVRKRNSNNIVRILKTYGKCSSFDQKEKRLLLLTLFFTLIIYLTVITWGVLTLFFPELIFN
ncbi:MAG TPA: hypothetical protein DIW31_11745 [Bacteroidales bacterium]|nr:hypothetical protein [Bacteroidales bacterium]